MPPPAANRPPHRSSPRDLRLARRTLGLTLRAALCMLLLVYGCSDPPSVQTASVTETGLRSDPIPAEWVLEGAPKARIKHLARAADGGLSAAIWDCSAGKFKWFFEGDEFVHILEGQVTIEDENGGGRHVLTPGDVAYFSAGTVSLWTVDRYVKKLALFRDNHVGVGFRLVRKLRRALSGKP